MINLSKILILVVTYNPLINIHEKYKLLDVDYLVVDNTPTQNLDVQTNQITNGKNTGIATALNTGAKYALENGYSWIITMDQDSHIIIEIIQQMLNFAKMQPSLQNIAIISPRHIMQDGSQLKGGNSQEYIEGLNTMTSGNLLNLAIWQKIGGFDDKLFIDMVDVDYYCKAMQNGYRVITLNSVVMSHHLGDLRITKLFGQAFRPTHHNYIRRYYQTRNSLYVYHKYKKDISQVKHVLRLFALKQWILVMLFEKDKIRKSYYMFKGLCDFLRGKFTPI